MDSNQLRIGILCNNKMALPAVHRLMQEEMLVAVATPDIDAEAMYLVNAMCEQQEIRTIPYTVITKRGHGQQLQEWVDFVRPDAVFVMTYPYRIPGDILSIPKYGFFNFHYGLLPEMRGADPIFESIRQRIPVAGATVHKMDEQLDTGPVVFREEFPLSPDLTYGMLSAQMATLGEKMCSQLATLLKSQAIPGNEVSVPSLIQDEAKAKYWPKVGKEEISIRWNTMERDDIIALVRSCNPISKGALTTINGWRIAVADVCVVNLEGDASSIAPGTIIALDHQNGMIVCCRAGRAVKLEVVYTSEGYFPGYKLALFGISQWMVFS